MKQIESIDELKKGDKIVCIWGEMPHFYEFLCIHPHNNNYVLLLDDITKDAPKFYIPNIINQPEWYKDYTLDEVRQKRIEYHEMKISRLKKRMNK